MTNSPFYIGFLKGVGFALVLFSFFTTGCTTLRNAVWEPVRVTNSVPAQVESRTVIITNLVQVPVTNSITREIERVVTVTNFTPVVTTWTNPPVQVVLTNGWVQKESVAPTIQSAAAVANVAAPGLGSVAGAVASGVLGLWGLVLNRQRNTARDTVVGLVKGIEDIRKATAASPDLAHIGTGIIDAIHGHIGETTPARALLARTVEEHTGNTNIGAAFKKA